MIAWYNYLWLNYLTKSKNAFKWTWSSVQTELPKNDITQPWRDCMTQVTVPEKYIPLDFIRSS